MAKGKPLTELEVGSIVSSEIKASLGYIGSDITEQKQTDPPHPSGRQTVQTYL